MIKLKQVNKLVKIILTLKQIGHCLPSEMLATPSSGYQRHYDMIVNWSNIYSRPAILMCVYTVISCHASASETPWKPVARCH